MTTYQELADSVFDHLCALDTYNVPEDQRLRMTLEGALTKTGVSAEHTATFLDGNTQVINQLLLSVGDLAEDNGALQSIIDESYAPLIAGLALAVSAAYGPNR